MHKKQVLQVEANVRYVRSLLDKTSVVSPISGTLIERYLDVGEVYKGRIEDIARYVGKREIKPNNPAVNLGLKIIQVKIALLEATPLKLGMTVDVRITPANK